MEGIFNLILELKYLGVGWIVLLEAGFIPMLFLPAATIVFSAGYVASLGFLNSQLLFFVIFLASLLSWFVGYFLGYVLNIFLKKYYNYIFENVYIKDNFTFFNSRYKFLIFFTKFIPIARTFIPFFAGFAKMNFVLFSKINLIVSILWTAFLFFSGYFLYPDIDITYQFITVSFIIASFLPFIPVSFKIIKRTILIRDIKYLLDPSNLSKDTRSLIRIFFIFIFPILLIYFGLIPKDLRFLVLLFSLLVIYFYIRNSKYTKEDLGFTYLINKKSLFVTILLSIFGIIFIYFFANLFGYKVINQWYLNYQFLFLFIPLSLAQEFLYRSFLTLELKNLFDNESYQILSNASLFTLLHIIYPHANLTLALTFLAGILFSVFYKYFKSFYLVSFLHICFNFVSVLFGLFATTNL